MVALTDFTFAVELATGSTPRTSAPSYTAITSYVMAAEGITLSRGRSSEQAATAQPGRASVSLRNTDNRFTMGNGSSPYAPLQLRRPCRFRVTYSATTYDLWQGFVDDWGNGRNQLTGVARLSLSDRISRAAKAELRSAMESAIRADRPALLYTLGEPSGSVAAADTSGNGGPMLELAQYGSAGTYEFGLDTTFGADPASFAAFTSSGGTEGYYLRNREAYTTGITAAAGTLEALMKIPPGGGPDAASVRLLDSSDTTVAYISLQTNANVYGRIIGGTIGDIIPTDKTYDDGQWHHYALTWSTSGTTTANLYVDGAFVGTASVTAAATPVVRVSLFGAPTTPAPETGSLAFVAAHATALSASTIANHADAARGWPGDTTAARFNRHCANAGLPSAFYATTGTTEKPMSAQPTAGKSLLDAVNECATTEGGVAYVSDTGVLTFATSTTRYNTAVGVTLDATKAGQVSADTSLATTDQDLVNDSSATRYGGSTFRTVDTASVDAYDLHDESETLHLALDAHALNWTQWRVAQFDTPAPRLDSVPVDVVAYANSGGNVANLLNAEIGTKIRITNLPADVSATSTLDLMIEGLRDEIGVQNWVRTFTTSPIGLNDTVWVLGTDLLGVGTVLGY